MPLCCYKKLRLLAPTTRCDLADSLCRVAFAELNTLLQHHQHLLKEVTIRSYHSFTREAKGLVLQRVIAADPAVRQQSINLLSVPCERRKLPKLY